MAALARMAAPTRISRQKWLLTGIIYTKLKRVLVWLFAQSL